MLESLFWLFLLVPILIPLLMSKTRETSTNTWAIAGIAISFGSISLIAFMPKFMVFFIGYFIALSMLIYREITIIQTSMEGKMKKNSDYPAKNVRFVRSTLIRFMQISPMITWVLILGFDTFSTSILLTAIFIHIIAGVVLALVEHRWLWI